MTRKNYDILEMLKLVINEIILIETIHIVRKVGKIIRCRRHVLLVSPEK